MKLAIITTDEERFIGALKEDDISIVITNNPVSPVIKTCFDLGIKYNVINHQDFTDRREHDRAIMYELDKFDIDLVILGGYKRLIKDKEFLDSYGDRMINIHNSYLPNFPGAKPHEEVFNSGVKKSGYTIHFVDAVMDRGEIILQEEIFVGDCNSPQEVYDKITERACDGLKRVVGEFTSLRVKQSLLN